MEDKYINSNHHVAFYVVYEQTFRTKTGHKLKMYAIYIENYEQPNMFLMSEILNQGLNRIRDFEEYVEIFFFKDLLLIEMKSTGMKFRKLCETRFTLKFVYDPIYRDLNLIIEQMPF